MVLPLLLQAGAAVAAGKELWDTGTQLWDKGTEAWEDFRSGDNDDYDASTPEAKEYTLPQEPEPKKEGMFEQTMDTLQRADNIISSYKEGRENYKKQEQQERQSNDLLNEANNLARRQKNQSSNQVKNWNEMWGPVDANVANYYKNLDARSLERKEFDRISSEVTKLSEKVKQQYMQRGLSDSGLEYADLTKIEIAASNTRAAFDADEELVIQQQKALQQSKQDRNTFMTADQTNAANLGTQLSNSSSTLANRAELNYQRGQDLTGRGPKPGKLRQATDTLEALNNIGKIFL